MLDARMPKRAARSEPKSTWARFIGSQRRFRISLASAGLLAVLLRFANVAALARIWGDRQILDAAFYHDEARFLAGATSTPLEPGPIRFANPGYSEFLAALYRLFTPEEGVGLTAQALCGGVTAVVLGLTASALFKDRRAGLIAALLWALYAPAIYYDGVLLTPSLTALLTACALGALVALMRLMARTDAVQRAAWLGWGLAAGVCVGGATLLRPSNVLLGVGFLALLLLGIAVVITPRIVEQHELSGDWIPLSANGGMNLWVGNSHDADGTYVQASFIARYQAVDHPHTVVVERNAYLDEARRESGDAELSLADASAFWRDRALDEISEDPLRWAGLELKKLLWFCNRHESRTNVSEAFLARFSPVLRFDPLGFGALAILGGIGLISRTEGAPARGLLAVVIAAPLAGCLIFFVSGEYRHPASPALVLAAAFALARLADGKLRWAFHTRADKLRSLAFVALCVLVLYPMPSLSDSSDAKAYVTWLVTVHPDGELPTRNGYEQAEAISGTLSDSFSDQVLKNDLLLLSYANCATQFADAAAAERLVSTAAKQWHLDPTPKNGVSEGEAESVHQALFMRVRQVASQPFVHQNPGLEHQLALLGSNEYAEIKGYLQAAQVDAARAFASDALALSPSAVEAQAERGRVELMAGNPQAALPWLEQSLNGWPKIALPAALLCELALQSGDRVRALALLREASARDAQYPEVLELQRMLAAKAP
jgi:Dolichyl-phosphate-mannose-protein mannosyltransferase